MTSLDSSGNRKPRIHVPYLSSKQLELSSTTALGSLDHSRKTVLEPNQPVLIFLNMRKRYDWFFKFSRVTPAAIHWALESLASLRCVILENVEGCSKRVGASGDEYEAMIATAKGAWGLVSRLGIRK